jgi:hypothetical protein
LVEREAEGGLEMVIQLLLSAAEELVEERFALTHGRLFDFGGDSCE